MERISVYKIINLIENGEVIYTNNPKNIKKTADIIDLFVELGANPYDGAEGFHTQEQFKDLYDHCDTKDFDFIGVDEEGDTWLLYHEDTFKRMGGIKFSINQLMRLINNASSLMSRYKTVEINIEGLYD